MSWIAGLAAKLDPTHPDCLRAFAEAAASQRLAQELDDFNAWRVELSGLVRQWTSDRSLPPSVPGDRA